MVLPTLAVAGDIGPIILVKKWQVKLQLHWVSFKSEWITAERSTLESVAVSLLIRSLSMHTTPI